MVEIEFDYNQRITVIQAKLDEPFQNLIDKFLQKSLIQPGSVYFLANGKLVNKQQNKVESFMSDLNKQNKKMQVLVNEIIANNAYFCKYFLPKLLPNFFVQTFLNKENFLIKYKYF